MRTTTHKQPNKIIVLQGVPAAGKSSWARNIVKDNKEYVIVCRDSIRESRGDYWIPEQENYITKVEEFQVRAAIESGLNVIVDATNLNPKAIAKWEKIAEETESAIEFKLFKVGYKEALERDKNRSRSVGEKTIKTFFKNYFLDDFNKETGIIDNRKILVPDDTLKRCIICDLDGTISLSNGRSPYDYSKVCDDKCDPRMRHLINLFWMYEREHIEIIFMSGREGLESCRRDTISWLQSNFPVLTYKLYMRSEGDYRKDAIIKNELYEKYVKNQYYVLAVFDDRNVVCDMWRELGLLCCQVYYGDF